MRRRHRNSPQTSTPHRGSVEEVRLLPTLATAEQIAEVIQVSPRTIHYWAEAGTIPTALRHGKVVRFHPPAVASALGICFPEFGVQTANGGSLIQSPPQPTALSR